MTVAASTVPSLIVVQKQPDSVVTTLRYLLGIINPSVSALAFVRFNCESVETSLITHTCSCSCLCIRCPRKRCWRTSAFLQTSECMLEIHDAPRCAHNYCRPTDDNKDEVDETTALMNDASRTCTHRCVHCLTSSSCRGAKHSQSQGVQDIVDVSQPRAANG